MMEGLNAERIRRAIAGTSRRGDVEMVQGQIDRVRRELGSLADMLGAAAQERISDRHLLSRAEAMRTRAADQVSATASRANETARQHPVAGLAVVFGIGLIAVLLSRR